MCTQIRGIVESTNTTKISIPRILMTSHSHQSLHCLKEFQCPDSYVKCSDGLQCIHEGGMCNGYSYCNDKSDEDEHMCKGKWKQYKHTCKEKLK